MYLLKNLHNPNPDLLERQYNPNPSPNLLKRLYNPKPVPPACLCACMKGLNKSTLLSSEMVGVRVGVLGWGSDWG